MRALDFPLIGILESDLNDLAGAINGIFSPVLLNFYGTISNPDNPDYPAGLTLYSNSTDSVINFAMQCEINAILAIYSEYSI